jgi:CTP synthase (UTP-ammonia lyase)
MKPTIGIIGDFDRRPTHLATQSALDHSISKLGKSGTWEWISTQSLLAPEGLTKLSKFSHILCAPGSPYRSLEGALQGIQLARENRIPFLGTCGGCQHAILEIARNLLGVGHANHAEVNPEGIDHWITPLTCALKGLESRIHLASNSIARQAYGDNLVNERFRCDYGLDPTRENALNQHGLEISGRDERGQAVVFELKDHPFFVGTLYQPQLTSTPENPHPLINHFLLA